ncbi:E3 ubiquitin protein ligase MBR2-like protein [Tanacetum coccineum]|uniref:RING-type E3 ubiquitin transferase n=1 Tax=Tanacetum coccineum TaxID=301880 RepID=A0ABQ5FFM3_9ASTR
MDESDDWSILSPTERRLLNNDLSNELNFGCVNVNTNSRNSNLKYKWLELLRIGSRGSIISDDEDGMGNFMIFKKSQNELAAGSCLENIDVKFSGIFSSGSSTFRGYILSSSGLLSATSDQPFFLRVAGLFDGRYPIRQVLHAMRRGGNLRAEDYMLFDPFINGLAEMHDRHREMRLDVDNMSYEELLALEERIGDVKTGLSEEVILKSMKQRRHVASMATSTQVLEPCCICQEEYETDDNIGSLDCGHDFHTDCIVQWLTQEKVCPISK